MELSKRARTLLITAVVLIVVAAIAGIIYAVYLSFRNPYGDQLEIANLSEYTAGKPTDEDRLKLIKHNLFDAVQFNSKEKLDSNSIDDVVIRKDSFSQTYSKSIDVHTVTFTVDIKSVKQSYKVSYQWAGAKENAEYVDEYGTQVTCLPLDELIYGDFKCVDERIEEMGVANHDPIQPLLPYHERSKFKIVDYSKSDIGDEDNRVDLEVEAYVPYQKNAIDQATLDEYTRDIRKWLQSRKLNPDNYNINYVY